jgi:2,4-dienoyl-CoA reductase-like NADH-dependent reductase (Old Yellow Enzyme family)
VIAAGRLETREICEQALDQGMADGIGLGRVLFCDPQWLHKISGENPEAVRGCVQCQTCQKKIMEGKPVECSRWTKEEKALYLRNVAAS